MKKKKAWRWDFNRKPWLIVPISVLFCVCLFFVLTESGGSGYFCPQTLQMRTHSERLIRGTDTVIYRSQERYYTPDLCHFLVSNGYWKKSNEPEEWCQAFRWNGRSDGRSRWYRELVVCGEDWIRWTKENPEWAKVFWPELLEVFRESDPSDFHPGVLLSYAKMTDSMEEYRFQLRILRESRETVED